MTRVGLTTNLDGEIMAFEKELRGQRIPKTDIAKGLRETQKAPQIEKTTFNRKRTIHQESTGPQAPPFLRKALFIPEIIHIRPVVDDPSIRLPLVSKDFTNLLNS